MPYIDKEARKRLDPELQHLIYRIYQDRLQLEGPPTPIAEIVGELNYCITILLLSTKPKRYSDWNSILGVLDAVGKELYRRYIAPYEDKKIADPNNGDVEVPPLPPQA